MDPKFTTRARATHPRQRGFSLIEMGVALVIIGGLIMAMYTLYRSMMLDRQVNAYRIDLNKTVNVIRSVYGSRLSTYGMDVQTMSLAGAWPSERVSNLGSSNVLVRGHFPGSTETVSGTGTPAAKLRINRVPLEACVRMLQVFAAQAGVSQIMVYEAGEELPSYNNLRDASNGQYRLSMANAVLACGKEGSPTKDIEFSFNV